MGVVPFQVLVQCEHFCTDYWNPINSLSLSRSRFREVWTNHKVPGPFWEEGMSQSCHWSCPKSGSCLGGTPVLAWFCAPVLYWGTHCSVLEAGYLCLSFGYPLPQYASCVHAGETFVFTKKVYNGCQWKKCPVWMSLRVYSYSVKTTLWLNLPLAMLNCYIFAF